MKKTERAVAAWNRAFNAAREEFHRRFDVDNVMIIRGSDDDGALFVEYPDKHKPLTFRVPLVRTAEGLAIGEIETWQLVEFIIEPIRSKAAAEKITFSDNTPPRKPQPKPQRDVYRVTGKSEPRKHDNDPYWVGQ